MNIETANRLLQYRKKFNLSQEELATKIGVSRQAISKWERAEASPDTDNLIRLAEVYGVSLDELLKGSSSETNESTTKVQPDSNTEYEKVDKVSFKNGIHVHSKSGDNVDLSFKDGIHINDKNGTKVNIDSNGINVEEEGKQKVYTDESGNVMYDKSMKHHGDKSKNIWNKFPFFIIAITAFLVWGFSGICFGWSLSWICFLTIPIYYTLVDAIYKHKASHFAYPILVVIAYILFGYFNICGSWSIGWVIFLTIPVYYWICDILKKK